MYIIEAHLALDNMVTALAGIKEQNSEFGSISVQYMTFGAAFFFFLREEGRKRSRGEAEGQ